MSNIDKGLDEIIASTGISAGGRRSSRAKKTRVGSAAKTLTKLSKAPKPKHATGASKSGSGSTRRSKSTAGSSVSPALLSMLEARRAVVSNMPLDVNEQAVRDYFSSNIGKVRKVEGSYRENGKPTGTYTITFEKAGHAQTLAEKFHGQPIDGGKTHMNVQILVDTVAAPKSLAGRIGAKAAPKAAASATSKNGATSKNSKNATGKNATTKEKQRRSSRKAAPVKAVEAVVVVPKKQKARKQPVKPRTAADLDAEMSDYFAKADNNEISV